MTNPAQLGKIRWRCCRRGMLELDVILTEFFDRYYVELEHEEQTVFQKLLETPDQELYSWLLGHTLPQDNELKKIIDKIRASRS